MTKLVNSKNEVQDGIVSSIFKDIKKILVKSWKDFKEEVGYHGVQIQNCEEAKETSVKAHNPTTYDRYDLNLGLHKPYYDEDDQKEVDSK